MSVNLLKIKSYLNLRILSYLPSKFSYTYTQISYKFIDTIKEFSLF